MIIKLIRLLLSPLRKFLTKLIIFDDKIAPWANPNYLEFSPMLIDLAAQFIAAQEIEGDYLEFGVFKGNSFIKAYNSINHFSHEFENFERTKKLYNNINLSKKSFNTSKKIERRFFAFDSFKGLPKVKTIDEGDARFDEGRYYCSKEDFKNNLLQNQIDLNNVSIIEGFYEDILKEELKDKINLNKAAIVFIDCDLYSSTKYVLDFIKNLVNNGTIIIFDDWFTYKGDPNKGGQRACKEWIEKNKNIKLIPYKSFHAYQMSFIVNLNYKKI